MEETGVKAKCFQVFYNSDYSSLSQMAPFVAVIYHCCVRDGISGCWHHVRYMLSPTATAEIAFLSWSFLSEIPSVGLILSLNVLCSEGLERVQKWSQRLLTLCVSEQ